MKPSLPFGLFLAAIFLLSTVGCHQPKGSSFYTSETITPWRYRNIDSFRVRSLRLLRWARQHDDTDAEAEALNHLAEERFQQMDFDSALYLADRVAALTKNQVELLAADIIHMRVAQRTSQSETFFLHRNRALRRIRRISEEMSSTGTLSSSLARRFATLRSDFHITSSTYFFYVDQQDRAIEEIRSAEPFSRLPDDTAQWLYYCYMRGSGGLSEYSVPNKAAPISLIRDEFNYLFECYTLAKNNAYLFFEANALQSLATFYADSNRVAVIRAYKPHADTYLRSVFATDTLAFAMAQRAYLLFERYDDLYQMACALRTLGELSFDAGRPVDAIDYYTHALDCVNLHHRLYYTPDLLTTTDADTSTDLLLPYDPTAPDPSVERRWMLTPSVRTVPEWIAGIRQQLSVAYSALGMKQESDFNRNIYLDLLDVTREDAELASRAQELRDGTRDLRWHLIFVLLLAAAVVGLGLLLHRTWHRRAEQRMAALRQSLQASIDTAQRQQEELEAEEELLHEQQAATRHRIRRNKQQNVEKRAKLQLVDAIVPYLDRIIHEVGHMTGTEPADKASLTYIAELTDRIDLLNHRLTEWIQMQQGELSLQLTTFPLQPLFDTLRRGHYAFDQKGISFVVPTSDSFSVKADPALTLFMLNTLADNARKCTSSGGKVQVEATANDSADGAYVELSVSDTGCGLSPEDIDLILNHKVYDPNAIAAPDAAKGFGFGLMNCKGIIEKYRKTSSFFRVCQFGIESRVGEGSRFWFRLPRVMVLIACILLPLKSIAVDKAALAADAAILADSVYYANLEGRYPTALDYADSALWLIDKRLLLRPVQTDVTGAADAAVDILLWREQRNIDFTLLLGLRNEVAVAALALHDWPLYRYNNRIYTRLYKLVNQDVTLEAYCQQMERAQTNERVAIALMLLLLLISIALAYFLYVRPQLAYRRTLAYAQSRHYEQLLQEREAERQRREENIEQANDEHRRRLFEENRLHVQNQIIDNCLSTIKHETMYFPGRIRQLVSPSSDTPIDVSTLAETLAYYKEMVTLLTAQAREQAASVGFRRVRTTVADIVASLPSSIITGLTVEDSTDGAVFFCDADLVEILLTQLIAYECEQTPPMLTLRATVEGRFVRFAIENTAKALSAETMHQLFMPHVAPVCLLVAKQIIREHDTFMGHPGCRIAAEVMGSGHCLWFTLPST